METGIVLRNGRPCASNFLRDFLEEIEKLAQACQLSEFTEHGLPHLGSLVERIQAWTKSDGTLLMDSLSNDEAFLLFFAILSHDIGMLVQRENDLKEADRVKYVQVFADLPMWIRRTHVHRIDSIIHRLFGVNYPDFIETDILSLGVALARSHQSWPDSEAYKELEQKSLDANFKPSKVKAIAGILAVADLLDEDSSRCDSMTMLANKAGNLMNRAHWLRHMLTVGCLKVDQGKVSVQIQLPSNLVDKLDVSLDGLRNHLLLAQSYNSVLNELQAEITLDFLPITKGKKVPEEPTLELLLCEPDIHIMRTFSDEALPGPTEIEPIGSAVEVMGVMLKRVDRKVFEYAMGPLGAYSGRSDYEITYAAASMRDDKHLKNAIHILKHATIAANYRGDVTTVRRLTSFVLNDLTSHQGSELNDDFFWAAAFSLHWAGHSDLITLDFLIHKLLLLLRGR